MIEFIENLRNEQTNENEWKGKRPFRQFGNHERGRTDCVIVQDGKSFRIFYVPANLRKADLTYKAYFHR